MSLSREPICGTIVVCGEARNDAEATVADVQQVARDAFRFGRVVPADARPVDTGIEMTRRDEGDVLGAQKLVQLRLSASPNQENRVHSAFDERAYFGKLAVQLIVRTCKEQLEAALLNGLLQAIDEF